MANQIPMMNWSNSDHGEEFALFRQKMELYIEDENITDTAAKARKICRGIGDDGLRRLNASGLTATEKNDPDTLWSFFEGQLKLNVNFRIHHLELMQFRQKADESIDDFITMARTQALKCDFTDAERDERLLELFIASTPFDSFRRDLLGQEKRYKLSDALAEGRRYEALTAGSQQAQSLGHPGQPPSINAIQARNPCGNSALQHAPRKCPAFGDKCKKCGKPNHWAKCCRSGRDTAQRPTQTKRPSQTSRRKKKTQQKKFHAMDAEAEYEANLYTRKEAEPSIDGPRKWSIHMLPKIKDKLESMEKDKVIRKLSSDEH